jgi:regulator of RNase E activity RraA
MQQYSNIVAGLSTANIADAHDHLGTVCKWLSRDLTSTRTTKFWGHADVVQWGPARKTADIQALSPSTWDEVKAFIAGLEGTDAPRVYVSGCKEISRNYVLLGGLSLSYLDKLGYAGAVSFGAIRDHEEVMDLKMPVWASGFAVMDSQGCMKVETRGTVCTVSGHMICQDDFIIGDGNGVVAIGRSEVDAVLAAATRIAEIEGEILTRIRMGGNLYDLVSGGGHI